MNFLQKIFRNKNAKTTPKNIQDYASITNIFEREYETAFSCIDKIATSFASLSYGVYNKKTKQKTEHPLYEVLKEPNLDETHSLFFYLLIKDYYAGNVYLYKYTDETGRVISLFRLNPSAVIVTRNEFNQKTFSYYGQKYDSNKILHIPSRFGYDGKTGKSIFSECKKTFETSSNLNSYTANTFDNSLGKRLVIDLSESYPNANDDEQQKIRNKYLSFYGGVENAGKPIVKTGKIKFETIDTGISDNRQAQLTENRQFQLEAIAQIFNIPIEYLTGKGITDLEVITTLFMTQAIQPLVDVFQEAFNKLFSFSEREKYYVEFNYNSILKTSLSSKIDAYTKQFMNGILTLNEIRQKENLPPLEAGSTPFVPANLMPLTKENIEAYMAKSKIEIENAELAKTEIGKGSDKI